MDEVERTFLELESLIVDPALKEQLEEVRYVNELLADDPTDHGDVEAIVQDRNDQWRQAGFIGQEMRVSGEVYFVGQVGDVEYSMPDESGRTTFTNYPFESRGFTMLVYPVSNGDNMIVKQELYLNGIIAIDDEEGVEGVSMETCLIPLNPDTFIEHRKLTSRKAAAWLEMYDQDTKAVIDGCVMTAADEAEATVLLRDVEWPEATGTKKEIKQQKRVIEAYLRSVIDYDRYLPYIVELLGDCEVLNVKRVKWEKSTIMSNDKSLLIIQYDAPTVTVDPGTKRFQLTIEASLVTKSKKDVTNVRIPLSTILSMESGRERLR